jgi:hypothetical protein
MAQIKKSKAEREIRNERKAGGKDVRSKQNKKELSR